MRIELKEIDKDTLKVGDWVGIAREVSYGWGLSFRHKLIFPAQITRITPKRTKFFTDKFGEHDKREVFCAQSYGKYSSSREEKDLYAAVKRSGRNRDT